MGIMKRHFALGPLLQWLGLAGTERALPILAFRPEGETGDPPSPSLSPLVAHRSNSVHRRRRGGGWRYPEQAGVWGSSILATGEEEAHHSGGSTTVVVGRWVTAALNRWRGRGGRRTSRRVAGCSGEVVAGVGGVG
jgi:hypothetical protein